MTKLDSGSGNHRIHGYDSVKGIAILLVVASHTWPLAISSTSTEWRYLDIALQLWRIYLMPIAVPAFMLVSLLLYYRRPAFKRRLQRLVILTVTWIGLQYAIYTVRFQKFPPLDLATLRVGGPSLSGYDVPTVLWFLIDLVMLTVLAEGYLRLLHRWPDLTRWFGSFVVIASLAGFAAAEVRGIVVDHWLMCNFVLYVVIAWWIHEGRLRGSLVNWASAFLMLSVAECALAIASPALTPLQVSGYARVAIVLGAVALVKWGQTAGRHKYLEWLGRRSLGIYVFHNVYWWLLRAVIPEPQFSLAGAQVWFLGLTTFLAVSLTLVTVVVLERTPGRKLIS